MATLKGLLGRGGLLFFQRKSFLLATNWPMSPLASTTLEKETFLLLWVLCYHYYLDTTPQKTLLIFNAAWAPSLVVFQHSILCLHSLPFIHVFSSWSLETGWRQEHSLLKSHMYTWTYCRHTESGNEWLINAPGNNWGTSWLKSKPHIEPIE